MIELLCLISNASILYMGLFRSLTLYTYMDFYNSNCCYN